MENMISTRQSAIKNGLEIRSRTIQAIRSYFHGADYLEIETPIRIPAPAPETHIDAVESGEWFLHTSPELCMKRLLAAGYPRIFQISHVFRKSERGGRHLPEFTLLEWYRAYHDYQDMMIQCEELITHVAEKLGIGKQLQYGDITIDLSRPWDRISVQDAFARYVGSSMEQALSENRFDERMGLEIEPKLGLNRPVFLIDYPAECGALARLKPSNPLLVERFELYICGLELCNAFSELTDATEQRQRFIYEMDCRRAMNKTGYPMPEPFLQSLQRMPPATGNAMGIDRLVMLFADAGKIDDVVSFTPEEL